MNIDVAVCRREPKQGLVGPPLLYLTGLASARSIPRGGGLRLDAWGSSPAGGARPWGRIQCVPPLLLGPQHLVCQHRAQAQAVLIQLNACPFADLAPLLFLSI